MEICSKIWCSIGFTCSALAVFSIKWFYGQELRVSTVKQAHAAYPPPHPYGFKRKISLALKVNACCNEKGGGERGKDGKRSQ
jgi:hypothetical protein